MDMVIMIQWTFIILFYGKKTLINHPGLAEIFAPDLRKWPLTL